jgi:hypothetical protein
MTKNDSVLYQDASKRPTRSWLFTPATRPERFAKAKEASADVQIIDLEDSVPPAEKESARRLPDFVPFAPLFMHSWGQF